MTFSVKTLRWVGLLAVGSCVSGGFVQAGGGLQRPPPTPEVGRMIPNRSSHFALHGRNQSMQMTPATVSSVDMNTGIVAVIAGDVALKVQFPPESLIGLKAGDAIKLHMGFSER